MEKRAISEFWSSLFLSIAQELLKLSFLLHAILKLPLKLSCLKAIFPLDLRSVGGALSFSCKMGSDCQSQHPHCSSSEYRHKRTLLTLCKSKKPKHTWGRVRRRRLEFTALWQSVLWSWLASISISFDFGVMRVGSLFLFILFLIRLQIFPSSPPQHH